MADARMEIYNDDTSLQASLDSRVFRLLTVADIGDTTSGSVSVDTTQGAVVVMPAVADTKYAPSVSVGSGSVSWDYGSLPSYKRDALAKLEIGVF